MLTEAEVLHRLREHCIRHGDQVRFAEQIGCSVAWVNAVLQGKKRPSPNILAAIGVERIVAYREVTARPEEDSE